MNRTSAQEFPQLPPVGIKIDEQLEASLQGRVAELQSRVDQLAGEDENASSWRPDVEVLIRAVRLALVHQGFYQEKETTIAGRLLDEADRRLKAISSGGRGLDLLGLQVANVDRPQLLVGGFRSEIDDSVQPFGLVLPADFRVDDLTPRRLDVWLHGRGDNKTELAFLEERMSKPGQYTPAGTVVLHPFGRHCNAFKFAGETDVYESIAHAAKLLKIDPQRIAIRGFSMGGAGCWHLAVHNPGAWFAVNPGAGFVDTIVYQGWNESKPYELTESRLRLMHWYDVLPWVSNLRNTRTVAYSGELDKQKLAADLVVAEATTQGIAVDHVVGAEMGHKIDADSAEKIDAVLAAWSEQPLTSPRAEIDFTTWTLRYNKLDWVNVMGLQEHWTPGRVQARITGNTQLQIDTSGIQRLKLDFSRSGWPQHDGDVRLSIDGQELEIQDWSDEEGLQVDLLRDQQWSVVERIDSTLRKRPGLQGPIDDAFCSRFLFVTPSRPASHGPVQRWIDRELKYAQQRWQQLMRGEVRVVADTEVSEQDIESCHLICFGDFSSNQYLRQVANGLPVKWTQKQLSLGATEFDPGRHAIAFCYPNPKNPNKYLVVNSGMTFRNFSNSSNSRQIAMLPDWAVLDVTAPDDGIFPGNVVADGFFDEQWQVKPRE